MRMETRVRNEDGMHLRIGVQAKSIEDFVDVILRLSLEQLHDGFKGGVVGHEGGQALDVVATLELTVEMRRRVRMRMKRKRKRKTRRSMRRKRRRTVGASEESDPRSSRGSPCCWAQPGRR